MTTTLQTMKQAEVKLCSLALAVVTLTSIAGCRSRAPDEKQASHNLIQHGQTYGNKTVYTICGITTSPEGKVSHNPEVIALDVIYTDGSGYILRSHDDETLVTIKPSGFPESTTKVKAFLLNASGYQRGFYGTANPQSGTFGQCSLAPLPREEDRQAMLGLSAFASEKCASIVENYKNGGVYEVFGQDDYNTYLMALNDSAKAMHAMARSRDKDPNGYRHLLGFQGELTTFGVK